jgi:hypothetical protein
MGNPILGKPARVTLMYDDCVMAAFRAPSANVRYGHTARHALWLAVLLVFPGGAQQPNIPRGPFAQPIGQPVGGLIDDAHGDQTDLEDRLRVINRERQKALVSDTNKLLKLASEFDSEVKGRNLDSLTPSQVRKLAEIEKLAHSVKDKMSYSVRGPSMIYQQFPYPVR